MQKVNKFVLKLHTSFRYGLILPSKNKNKAGGLGTRKLNPLLDSDDELDQDEESPLNWVEASLKVTTYSVGFLFYLFYLILHIL